MKISYAILVKDEIGYIEKLINKINDYKDEEDEIVVLQDIGEFPTEQQKQVKQYLLDATFNNKISYYFSTQFKNDFSEIKNKLNSKCKGNYIFNIDADEIPCDNLLDTIKPIIENNPDVELFYVPRVNTVKGLTSEHINKWRWNVSTTLQYGDIINFPDLQGRIYKNVPYIKWKNKVHEIVDGVSNHTQLPYAKKIDQTRYDFIFDFVLIHHKDIERQEKQNKLYEEIK